MLERGTDVVYHWSRNTNEKGKACMKPRIFISSTFYDLKYMREDISNFVKAHDFDPIMFEDGDIGYTPSKDLDESCYETMKSADMVILIIGGNYGSPATGEKADSFNEYLSVTRKEFETATYEGIPIYVFVEAAVYAEYGIYEFNMKKIESQNVNITFKATKNINVFRFIKEIHSLSGISITDFRKTSEIKEFLSKQWSDMFKNYLQSLKEEKNSKQMYEAMNNLQSLIKQMGIMVDGLGKKIIGNEEDINYDRLLKQQVRIQAREIAKRISDSFKFFAYNNNKREENTEVAYSMIKNSLDDIRKYHENIDISKSDDIFDLIKSNFEMNQGVDVMSISLDFYKKWEDNIDICDNEELSKEVLKILKNDFYNCRLFISEKKGELQEK